jgi:hypothetical protein
VLTQEGTVSLRPGSEQTVYYPLPYASPPNLELQDNYDSYEVVEQKETCFRIRSGSSPWNRPATWKARGVRALAPVPSVPTPPFEPTPPPMLLPPTPIPVPAPSD